MAGKTFDDEHLDILSHVLDDFIQIPGTSIRFGLDGIVGVIPGIGDLIGGIASCIIIIAAWVRGCRTRCWRGWWRMSAIEVVVGAIPVVGDMFDIAWRANRRNYALLTGSLEEPDKYRRQSWWFLGGAVRGADGAGGVPTLLFAWLAVHVLQGVFGFNIHGMTAGCSSSAGLVGLMR